MNTKIVLGILVAAILIGGAYFLVQKRPSAAPVSVADWKTYTSDTYGFSFKYPPTWSVTESNNGLELGSADDNSRISFSPYPVPEATNVSCPSGGVQIAHSAVDSFHLEGCENLINANKVPYARETIAGMSTATTYQEKTLEATFLTGKYPIVEATLSVDANGMPLSAEIFDEILQSITVSK